MATGVGRRAHLGGLQRGGRAAQVLRARDAALPLGRAPHRSPEELLGRRRGGPFPAPERLPRAASHGLRRLWPERGEPRHQYRAAPARVDRELDRGVPAPVPRLGHLDRLEPRVRDPRAQLLQVDAVDLPAPARARPRVPQGGGGQVVPEGRHRARQRAGDRRPLRALRHPGGGPPARTVVLQDHRVRRPPARRHASHRVAAERSGNAGELDRPLGGRRGDLPL
jgi:hypothetical protein